MVVEYNRRLGIVFSLLDLRVPYECHDCAKTPLPEEQCHGYRFNLNVIGPSEC